MKPPSRRPLDLRQALLAAALALGAVPCLGAAAPERANVLLITLDTFRGDFLGANGASRVATPCLDRLAAAGANFRRARAQVPLTLPSHASILSGLHPHSHGLRDNGAGALAAEVETLAEVLRAEGWATAAFVGSFVLDHRFGLDQGFDHYDDRVAAGLEMLERVEAERDGGAVLAAFEAWLAERPAGESAPPFLAWIHLYDPHAPYRAPEPWAGRYRDEPYAAEVAWTDSLVCRATAALEAPGVSGRKLVAVVGDHGEGLGEHRESTHALLIYNSTIHVPMLLHAPGRVPAVGVPDLVRTLDLAPTLLDYLGLEAALGEGVSLRPLVERRARGAEPPPPLAALSESLYGARNLGWSPLFGLEEGRYRFIQAPEPELYDVERDPGETRNLYGEATPAAERLARRLEALLAGAGAPAEAEPAALDEAQLAKLRSLGYLGGGAAPSTGGATADPKAKIEVWERLHEGMALFERGDYERAALLFEGVARSERDVPLLYEYLGAAYARLGAWEKLERLAAAAVARGVDSASLQLDLGRLERRRGAPERARAAFDRALALDPTSVTARHELGELYRATGRYRDARDAYRAALAINPEYAYAWSGLGVSLSLLGEPAAALAAFERAVELAPDDARALLNLAAQLERMDRPLEAARAYGRCLELLPAGEGGEIRERVAEALKRLQ